MQFINSIRKQNFLNYEHLALSYQKHINGIVVQPISEVFKFLLSAMDNFRLTTTPIVELLSFWIITLRQGCQNIA